jgi:type II secretion system protein C
MGRVAIWIVNAALFVLCCFLVAGLANAMIAQWMGPEPEMVAAAAPRAAAPKRTWADRQVILDKNLFNVSTLLPQVAPVDLIDEDEPLEATKLPLRLLGTVASSDAASSWAAVEDQQAHKEMVVQVGDKLLDKATVEAIQRRRLVLLHNGLREELALDEEDASGSSVQPAARPSAASTARSDLRSRRRAARPADAANAALKNRVRQVAEDRFAVDRGEVESAMRNTAELFSQARILPKYTNGEMVGVQLSAIQEGSLFQEMGIQDGDVITEVNGIVVSTPQDNAALLRELGEADEFTVTVTREDGSTQTLNYVVGDE